MGNSTEPDGPGEHERHSSPGQQLPEVLTVQEAAQLLRANLDTVRRLAASGEIPARRVGGRWRFSRRQLVAYIEHGSCSGHPAEPS